MQNLVLVHGYLGGSVQWQDQVEALSAHFKVHTPDLPGYGLHNDQLAPESISGFANYVLDWLSDQGVDSFHLLGHSMGGMIVQEMTALAPHRVNKLVLYGTGSVGLLPGRFETIDESKRRVIDDGPEANGRRISATWFKDYEQSPNYPVCGDLSALASEQAALAGLTAMENWSGEAELENITSETLVLWGDCDRTYTWAQQQTLWQTIKGARLAVIQGCAHATHLEKPALFNMVLQDFLEG